VEIKDENLVVVSGQSISSEPICHEDQQLAPFVSATPTLIRLNTTWKEQLKTEKERVRHGLITGNYDKEDGTLDFDAAMDAVVTVMDLKHSGKSNLENCGSILPVVLVTTNFPSQKTIADEFTLNREQRAAFMIITSHLDGDTRCRTGITIVTIMTNQRILYIYIGDNNGQLIMCIPGCGGTGKSQLIRALGKYFFITKRMQMMRKLAPTGIAAAEIDGMTIHSFLGEQRHSGKPRTIKPGDSKLESEWRRVEYLLIDEMSMVGLTLLAKLNRIMCAAKHVDPQVPFGGVNVILFGDYLQYRPVFDAPLHTDFSMPARKKSTKVLSEKEIQQRVARSLILQINCVVKLTQQMRTEDQQYLELLERFRRGECDYNDYELLSTRVVGQPTVPSLRDFPWNKVHFMLLLETYLILSIFRLLFLYFEMKYELS
jgi:PIF1-like helicase